MPHEIFKLARGTTVECNAYAGPAGELVVDTDNHTVVVQTGSAGGVRLAKLTDLAAGGAAYTAGTGLSLSPSYEFSVNSTAGSSLLDWDTEVTLGTVGGLEIKAKLPSNPNSDTLVTQTVTTTSSYYPMLFKNTTGTTTVTDTTRFSSKITANASTGVVKANQFFGVTSALSGTAITVTNGACFTKTISAATTFTFSGASGCVTFTLVLTNGGSKTITWPSSVKWANGVVPTLTASGVDVLTFLTPNSGTTWYGVANSINAA